MLVGDLLSILGMGTCGFNLKEVLFMTVTEQQVLTREEGVAALIQGIDHVELYVSNARQAAHYYRTAFGFTPIAYAGLETGLRDRMSYVLQLGDCYLVVTSPLSSQGPVADYVSKHGDGVKDIALRVSDVEKVYATVVARGAQSVLAPTVYEDGNGRIQRATVGALGDVVHSLVTRSEFSGSSFWPQYQALKPMPVPWTGLHLYDHFALSLPHNMLTKWSDFYTHIFEFHKIHEEGIQTEYSAMKSIAVQDSGTDSIRFVLVEPIAGKRKSQVEEFLQYHEGPGIQHVALHTQDVIRTIHALQFNGVEFVSSPASYYDMLPERVGKIDESIQALKEISVLVDSDEWGYLLQIFSRPMQSRPTFFMEIIQRHDARGFGGGNIQALFKALEREQERRGNL
jgi:4-hydroxyphenylpyruvate dioxygenase